MTTNDATTTTTSTTEQHSDGNLLLVVVEEDVEFESVVGPRAELQLARLDVEREVDDVDGTGRLEDGRRHPEHRAVGRHDRHCLTMLFQPLIRTIHAKQCVQACVLKLYSFDFLWIRCKL